MEMAKGKKGKNVKSIVATALIFALCIGLAPMLQGFARAEEEAPFEQWPTYYLTNEEDEPLPSAGNSLEMTVRLYIIEGEGINSGTFGIEYNSKLLELSADGFQKAGSHIEILNEAAMNQLTGGAIDGVGIDAFSWGLDEPLESRDPVLLGSYTFTINTTDYYINLTPDDIRLLDFDKTLFYENEAAGYREDYWADLDEDDIPNYIGMMPNLASTVEIYLRIRIELAGIRRNVSGTILTRRIGDSPAMLVEAKRLLITIEGRADGSGADNIFLTSEVGGYTDGSGREYRHGVILTESVGKAAFSALLTRGSYKMTVEKAGYVTRVFDFTISVSNISGKSLRLPAGNADYKYADPTWQFEQLLRSVVGDEFVLSGSEEIVALDLAEAKDIETGIRADINEDNMANHLSDIALVLYNFDTQRKSAPEPLSAAVAETDPGYSVNGKITGTAGNYKLIVTIETQGTKDLLVGRLGLAYDTDKLELLESGGNAATNYTSWEEVVSETELIELYAEVNSTEAGAESKMFSVTQGYVLLSWHANADSTEIQNNAYSVMPEGEIATIEFNLKTAPSSLDSDTLRILEAAPAEVDYWDSSVMVVVADTLQEHQNISLEYPTSQTVTIEPFNPGGSPNIGGGETKPEETVLFRKAFLNGYTDGTFRPDGSITRAEVAAIIARIISGEMTLAEHYPSDFTDVDLAAWYADYIGLVSGLGIMIGDGNGFFRPDDKITREEFSKVACEAATRLAYITAIEAGTPDFVDTGDISPWAVNYIFTAQKHGWMTGDEHQMAMPKSDLKRSEAAKIIDEMQGRLLREESIKEFTYMSFPDVKSGNWHYYYVIAAANDYFYEKDGQFDLWVSVENN